MAMLQVVQPLNAAWRASLSDATALDRAGDAAIARLAAMILSPLYLNLKPLDPVKKSAKVTTLYMHAAMAHVRHRVVDARAGPGIVTDDNMEGYIRGLGRFVYKNASNASKAALLEDLAAVRDASLAFVTARSHPSSLVYTKHVRIWKCWTSLSVDGDEDFSAIRKVVEGDPELSIGPGGTDDVLVVTLPLPERADANGERRTTNDGRRRLGKKEALRRGLRHRQRVLIACICGRLGGKKSVLVEFLLRNGASATGAGEGAASTVGGSGAMHNRAGRHGGQGGGASLGTPSSESGGESALHGDDTCSAMSSNGAVNADDGWNDGQLSDAVSPQQPKVTARSRVIAAVATPVPPRWALGLVLPTAAVSAAGGTWREEVSAAPCSLPEHDAGLHKQVVVMRLLLHRTRTYAFTSWAVAEGVARVDFVETVHLVLDRLEAAHTRLVFTSRR